MVANFLGQVGAESLGNVCTFKAHWRQLRITFVKFNSLCRNIQGHFVNVNVIVSFLMCNWSIKYHYMLSVFTPKLCFQSVIVHPQYGYTTLVHIREVMQIIHNVLF